MDFSFNRNVLQQVIDQLSSGNLLRTETSGFTYFTRFSMSTYFSEDSGFELEFEDIPWCGSVACIAGHIVLMHNKQPIDGCYGDEACRILECNSQQTKEFFEDVFLGSFADKCLSDITRSEAVEFLKVIMNHYNEEEYAEYETELKEYFKPNSSVRYPGRFVYYLAKKYL